MAPHVLVVLVAHDGAAWLHRTLDGLEAQSHPGLDVVAIDNGSTDRTREVLFDRLGPDRVLVAERDLGFGAAVSMALDARPAAEAPYVLLLHDDLVLDGEAIHHLVAAMEADPRLAVVGPKLLTWRDGRELQSVGWTVDITGRADSGVDEGELDQGQRDQERRALYVSTGGMLVRRDALDSLGRFDRRYHLFRDDLDLCWRAWLAGYDVEVAPAAHGRHAAAATNYLRLGQTRFIGPRYFAERNTLATLLKNYGAARLVPTVTLYFLVGIAKVLGFLLTRRVSDAWQTVRAWLWNVLHLRETWRLRREVQRTRVRSDAELRDLFGKLVPRVRAYVEAIADWVAGGDVGEPDPEYVVTRPSEPEPAWRRVVRFVGRRPVLVTAALLALVFLGGAAPLLASGELRGGEFAAWPEHPAAFLGDYASGWHEAGPFGTAASPSPSQALLGFVHLLAGGSAYLAPRLLLLGLPLVAWLLALRAAQVFSDRRLPRVVAATAYVLSPPMLATLAAGRLGALVVAAALPGLVAAGDVLARPDSSPERAWRAVAAVALLAAVAGAFEPMALPTILLGAAALLAVAAFRVRDGSWRRALSIRIGVAAFGPLVLLLPWSLELVTREGPWRVTEPELVASELWRWVALAPDLPGIPGLLAGVGFVLAGLLGLALGAMHRPRAVAGLWLAALLGAGAAWWLGRTSAATWPGLALLLTAAAFAGLLAVAFATAEAQLTRHAFGWRQLAALATGVAVTVSLVVVATTLARGPWDAYQIDTPPLPAFLATAAAEGEPFRVLVLADHDGEVLWEVVDGAGPTMAAYGVPAEAAGTDLVAPFVADALSGRDPSASARLGTLNIRYVVVPPGGESDALDDVLRAQPHLEPRPVAAGRVLAVSGWLPRAAILSDEAAAVLDERGTVPSDAEVRPLRAPEAGRFRGSSATPGVVVIAERPDEAWTATANARPLPRTSELDAPTLAFGEAPAGAAVEVLHLGGVARTIAVTGQLLALLLAISLALRPPSFARRVPDDAVEGPAAPAPRAPEVVA